ncbi:sirohydrochlorin chelatase [Euzebya tangerina]|uniref:sirohydrochlorin chelatase n=1 Tax=Euzebya tangerina TaxID=591198 RepID=UPI0013C349E4|nr:sirohydrochlorin chelatase [Euzebya tangerina]
MTHPPHDHPSSATGLLLIAHGTRDPAGAEEMEELVAAVSQRVPVPVAHAWLEDFSDPQGVEGARPLIEGHSVSRLVTLPLLNFAAGHAKNDVPEQLAEIKTAFPDIEVTHGRVLGVHPDLLELAWRRLDAVSPRDQRADEVLLVAASGSSDPDANGELYKAARMLAEGSGHRWVETCVAGVTWPKTDEVLARVAAAGAKRVVVFSWSLLAGLLERRIWEAVDAADPLGMTITKAGRFGPSDGVADAIVQRFTEALGGDIRANCDACVYRIAFPGREERQGAPSAGGVRGSRHVDS